MHQNFISTCEVKHEPKEQHQMNESCSSLPHGNAYKQNYSSYHITILFSWREEGRRRKCCFFQNLEVDDINPTRWDSWNKSKYCFFRLLQNVYYAHLTCVYKNSLHMCIWFTQLMIAIFNIVSSIKLWISSNEQRL